MSNYINEYVHPHNHVYTVHDSAHYQGFLCTNGWIVTGFDLGDNIYNIIIPMATHEVMVYPLLSSISADTLSHYVIMCIQGHRQDFHRGVSK